MTKFREIPYLEFSFKTVEISQFEFISDRNDTFFTKTYEHSLSLIFASKENANSTCDISSLASNTFYMESKIHPCDNCLPIPANYLFICS